jgi:hypothetical protein
MILFPRREEPGFRFRVARLVLGTGFRFGLAARANSANKTVAQAKITTLNNVFFVRMLHPLFMLSFFMFLNYSSTGAYAFPGFLCEEKLAAEIMFGTIIYSIVVSPTALRVIQLIVKTIFP